MLILGISRPGLTQRKEPVNIQITIDSSITANLDVYTITVYNISDTPICLMHSTFINLLEDIPEKLPLFQRRSNGDLFSLEYSMKDTLYDYEGDIVNFNAQTILPTQKIKFNLLLPKSISKRFLKIDYLLISDFCYLNLKRTIFKNPATWYLKYKRLTKELVLPE